MFTLPGIDMMHFHTDGIIVVCVCLQEITILSVLRHPNLVQFLGATVDTATTNEPPMIVYELMHGGSLEDFFRG